MEKSKTTTDNGRRTTEKPVRSAEFKVRKGKINLAQRRRGAEKGKGGKSALAR